MSTDTDLQELKQEVEELKAVTLDTNRQVHKMRRAVWQGRLLAVVWWLAVFGVSGAAYYYYAQPYIEKIQATYAGFQRQAGQAQNLESQIGQFFSNYASYFSAPAAPKTPTTN